VATSSEIRGGDLANGYRASVHIPCEISLCPGQFTLITTRNDGTLLERPYNDGPYYVCSRPGCYWREVPREANGERPGRGLHEISHKWIVSDHEPRKKTESYSDLNEKTGTLV
jgi:hypothetical protein